MKNKSYEEQEKFDKFYFEVKAISELLVYWCVNEGEDDNTLFLAECLEKCVDDFEQKSGDL